jgi:hypothetical protein
MSSAVIIAAILAQTGLLVWLEARSRRALRSVEASLGRIDARLGVIEARFAPSINRA